MSSLTASSPTTTSRIGPSGRSFSVVSRNEQVVALRAGAVRVRHQQPGVFDLSWNGEQPMLLFLFNAAHGESVDGEACRSGSFSLLTPGAPTEVHRADLLEVLAIAYDDVTPARLGAGEQALGERPRFDLVDPGVRAIAHEIRRVLLRERRPSSDYIESLARSMLTRALQVIGAVARPRRPTPMIPLKLRRVIAHIDSRLDERITVAELGAITGMSRTHFTRAFESATGETPHRFILSRRLARVREMLEQAPQDLATLAARTGFSSHAHMTTAFKRAFGLTPAAYRKTLSERGDRGLTAAAG